MICALIAAAGSGTRTGLNENKIFFKPDNETVIEKTVNCFLNHKRIDGVYIICSANDKARLENMFGEKVSYVIGGLTRGESVLNGLKTIENKFDIVLVHDGARPYITCDIIDRVIDNIKEELSSQIK